MNESASQAPEQSASEPIGSDSEPPNPGARMRKIWIALCLVLLAITTPIALYQIRIPLGWLHLQRRHWLFSPWVIPPESDLPFIQKKILALSRNDRAIWIGGKDGLFARSNDEGAHWTYLPVPIGTDGKVPDVVAIQWFDNERATMLTSSRTIYTTFSRGSKWSSESRFEPFLTGNARTSGQIPLSRSIGRWEPNISYSVGDVVDWQGWRYQSRIAQTSGAAPNFGSGQWIPFTENLAGSSFSPDATGIIRSQTQATKSCEPASIHLTPSDIERNAFVQLSPTCVIRPTPLVVWSVSTAPDSNAIWRTSPSSGEFAPITRERAGLLDASFRLPPPWYILFAIPLAGLLLLKAARTGIQVVREDPSIANRAISDKPLAWDDEDYLGFHAMARGISLFIRNKNTGAPLVLAISGPWGSGKSSLMNLLKINMQEVSRTVWFNAWHHQSEEQLLAALFQAVRVQVLGDLWTPGGIWRRIQLAALRYTAKWPVIIVSLVAVMGIVWEVTKTCLDFYLRSDAAGAGAHAGFGKFFTLEFNIVFWGIAALVALGKKAKDALGSLIANPAALLASCSTSVTLKDLDAQTTFRERFAEDFARVTRALGKRRLVILIDDLDRCRPEKIREVMEAINFLVSSGDCFVILGIARANVEFFLGYSFKPMIDIMPLALLEQAPADPNIEPEKATLFAHMYLDKLIQIDIPVPEFADKVARQMIAGDLGDNSPGGSIDPDAEITAAQKVLLNRQKKLQGRFRKGLVFFNTYCAPVIFGILLFIPLSWPLKSAINTRLEGTKVIEPAAPTTTQQVPLPPPPITRQRSPTASSQKPKYVASETEPAPPPLQIAPDGTNLGVIVRMPPNTSSLPVYAAAVLLLLLFGTTCLRLTFTLREELLVDDSSPFTEALKVWSPLIHRAYPSPRGVKRFLNKARFIAMRQRGISDADPVPSIERFARYLATQWLRLRGRGSDLEKAVGALEKYNKKDRKRIDEGILVAIAALESDSEAWSLLLNKRDAKEMPDEFLSYLQRIVQPEDRKSIAAELARIWQDLTQSIDLYCQIIQPGTLLKELDAAPAASPSAPEETTSNQLVTAD